MISKKLNVSDLPTDLIREIFYFACRKETTTECFPRQNIKTAVNLQLTCKKFRIAFTGEYLWKRIYDSYGWNNCDQKTASRLLSFRVVEYPRFMNIVDQSSRTLLVGIWCNIFVSLRQSRSESTLRFISTSTHEKLLGTMQLIGNEDIYLRSPKYLLVGHRHIKVYANGDFTTPYLEIPHSSENAIFCWITEDILSCKFVYGNEMTIFVWDMITKKQAWLYMGRSYSIVEYNNGNFQLRDKNPGHGYVAFRKGIYLYYKDDTLLSAYNMDGKLLWSKVFYFENYPCSDTVNINYFRDKIHGWIEGVSTIIDLYTGNVVCQTCKQIYTDIYIDNGCFVRPPHKSTTVTKKWITSIVEYFTS